ncbi:MAG: biotin carboxylase N-terminal domain-containing protein [Hyphomonadaceae bacterium]|nr:biotin carboxylase N-terminal domain-containing protein [Hyphomonadaceae bacterium]
MFTSLLVANRGEIACRIFRTARARGVRCIAVYSDADAKAKHVREADAAVHIGPAPAADSYLRGDKIIAAALESGAAAIHPGYGFLSENPDFAQAVIDAGLIWVGPKPASIRAMGLKDEAKRIAIAAGVPVLPGYQDADQSEKTLLKAAKAIGFPVLIKAVAGGGGRGIREVNTADEFSAQLQSAQREAQAAFGDARVLIEKLVQRPRHIEVQVFGDGYGGLVHLFERDCSLQRRRQKVIEEAPAPGMTDAVRAAMTEAALKVARAVNYENAGTVEFIVDGNGPLRPDGFWFMEMNTRLQVEHPVTESVTGVDLVDWQLRVAAGEKLPLTQDQITLTGHAVEARICAEDPSEGFRPSVGRLRTLSLPHYMFRIDSGFDGGDVISPFYDSLVAKFIVHQTIASPRQRQAVCTFAAAELGRLAFDGVTLNVAFLIQCLVHDDMLEGRVHTGLISDHLDALASGRRYEAEAAIFAALAQTNQPVCGPFAQADAWRLNGASRHEAHFERAGEAMVVALTRKGDGWTADVKGAAHTVVAVRQWGGRWIEADIGGQSRDAQVMRRSDGVGVLIEGELHEFLPAGAAREHADVAASDEIKAPLPGKIVGLSARAGDAVTKGDALVTLEAMKMEHQLKAPRDGVVAAVHVAIGAQVKEGGVLIALAPLS